MDSKAWRELKSLRHQGHNAFDRIWQAGFVSRVKLYTMLANELQIPQDACHFALFDKETCLKAIKFCRNLFHNLLPTRHMKSRKRGIVKRRAIEHLREEELNHDF